MDDDALYTQALAEFSRLSSVSDCSDAQAPIWLPRGRLAK
jgi:hypothetical protein